jgi:hypothetical protein
MATVSCPSCGRALEVEDEYRDWTVRCPHCEHEFVPSEVASTGLMDDEPAPSRRRRRRDDDYEDDYEEDRPRRRRRQRYDDDYDRDTRDEAATLVAAPSMWLEICGWGGALVSIGGAILLIALGAELINNPPRNRNANDDPGEMFVVMGFCLGILGLPYSMAMAIGARKMRNLTGRGWAMTAAILGVASIALFGLLGIIQTAIGIWALVALNNPIVIQAFNDNDRYRSRRSWDD